MGGHYYSQQLFCEEGGGKTSDLLQEGEQLVKKIGGVFAFNVKDGPGGETARWVVDVKSGQGCVTVDPGMCRRCFRSCTCSEGHLLPHHCSQKGKNKPQCRRLDLLL